MATPPQPFEPQRRLRGPCRQSRFRAPALAAGTLTTLLLMALAYFELTRPDLLLVGNITIDLVDGTRPIGGAVSYAAAAVKALGLRACVVTVAGPDADLSIFDGLDLHVVPAESTLTFEHTYTWFGSQRRLRVTANPNITLGWQDVPFRCRIARAVLLGPLTLHDVDAGSFLPPSPVPPARQHSKRSSSGSHPLHPPPFNSGYGMSSLVSIAEVEDADFGAVGVGRMLPDAAWWRWAGRRVEHALTGRQPVGLMAQGFQRQLIQGGRVMPLEEPSPQLWAGLGPTVSLFLSDVETDTWAPGQIQAVAGSTERLLVTRGSKGAVQYGGGAGPKGKRVPPIPVDRVVDTNGAGDTFATAYMAALLRGDSDPGATASWVASRAVMMPQSCKPACACDRVAGTAQPWHLVDRLRASWTTHRRQAKDVAAALVEAVGAQGHRAAATASAWWVGEKHGQLTPQLA